MLSDFLETINNIEFYTEDARFYLYLINEKCEMNKLLRSKIKMHYYQRNHKRLMDSERM
jgi:hypothetical protein